MTEAELRAWNEARTGIVDTISKPSVEPEQWIFAALVRLPALFDIDSPGSPVRLEAVGGGECEEWQIPIVKVLDPLHPDAVEPAFAAEAVYEAEPKPGASSAPAYRGWVTWQVKRPMDGCTASLHVVVQLALSDIRVESKTRWTMGDDGTVNEFE